MSYILNALRKSEQERNSESAPSAQDLPREFKEEVRHTSQAKLIMVLVAINLGFMGYLWQAEKLPGLATSVQIDDATKVKSSLKSVEIPVAHEPETHTSISDWVAAREKMVPVSIPSIIETKAPDLPQEQAKKSASKRVTDKAETKNLVSKPPIATVEVIKEKPVALAEERPRSVETKPMPETRPEVKAVRSDIPLLRELDADFQSKVPAIMINVLAYDESPNARFVIIDMVKYRIGQHIKDTIQLKDILPDSLVLTYAGRDFRIEQP